MIEEYLSKLNIPFNDALLYRAAFTHKSFSRDNNERLEFLGDAILDLVIGEALFDCYPNKAEGELSRYRAELVQGSSLAEIARELSLDEQLLLGAGEAKTGGRQRDSILAGAFEAFIGALYRDQGYAYSEAFIKRLFNERVSNVEKRASRKDPKTALQELLQSTGLKVPEYKLQNVSGKGHKQTFTMECLVQEKCLSVKADGKSKKEAEKKAAEQMLTLLVEK